MSDKGEKKQKTFLLFYMEKPNHIIHWTHPHKKHSGMKIKVGLRKVTKLKWSLISIWFISRVHIRRKIWKLKCRQFVGAKFKNKNKNKKMVGGGVLFICKIETLKTLISIKWFYNHSANYSHIMWTMSAPRTVMKTKWLISTRLFTSLICSFLTIQHALLHVFHSCSCKHSHQVQDKKFKVK